MKRQTFEDWFESLQPPYKQTSAEAREHLANMTQEELWRCHYAAQDMRMQAYHWPLLAPQEKHLPPTMRWGTSPHIGLEMMESLREQP